MGLSCNRPVIFVENFRRIGVDTALSGNYLVLDDAADLFAYLNSEAPKPRAPRDPKKLQVCLVSGSFEYKSDEWARFCGAVTDWEREIYWEDIP